MADQSHREEMSAAIRAQRERHAVARTIAPAPPPAPSVEPEAPEPEQRKSFWRRLRAS